MTIETLLPSLGHRNWVAVVDAAYPEMVAPGVTTITGGDLESVVKALDAARHVRVEAFLDTELDYLSEEDCAGVDAFRVRTARLLAGHAVVKRPHEELIEAVAKAAANFRVLIVKTDRRIPYTSVFFRLECGYWDTCLPKLGSGAASQKDNKAKHDRHHPSRRLDRRPPHLSRADARPWGGSRSRSSPRQSAAATSALSTTNTSGTGRKGIRV